MLSATFKILNFVLDFKTAKCEKTIRIIYKSEQKIINVIKIACRFGKFITVGIVVLQRFSVPLNVRTIVCASEPLSTLIIHNYCT